jgi:hypothetical protein
MTRRWLLFGVTVVAGFALTIGVGFSGPAHGPSREVPARSTAREFFQTINARHFGSGSPYEMRLKPRGGTPSA